MAFTSDETTTGGGKTIKEISQAIRAAGAEEKPQPKESGPTQPDQGAAPTPPTSEPAGAAPAFTPNDVAPPVAEPGPKTPGQLAQPPEAYLDPSQPDPNAAAAPPAGAPNASVVGEMGAQGSLTDHLTDAFREYLDGGKPQEKPKTMAEQSQAIRSAGSNEFPRK